MSQTVFYRLYKYASMGLTVFGVFLITKHVIDFLLERRQRREIQKRYVKHLSVYKANNCPQLDQFCFPRKLYTQKY